VYWKRCAEFRVRRFRVISLVSHDPALRRPRLSRSCSDRDGLLTQCSLYAGTGLQVNASSYPVYSRIGCWSTEQFALADYRVKQIAFPDRLSNK